MSDDPIELSGELWERPSREPKHTEGASWWWMNIGGDNLLYDRIRPSQFRTILENAAAGGHGVRSVRYDMNLRFSEVYGEALKTFRLHPEGIRARLVVEGGDLGRVTEHGIAIHNPGDDWNPGIGAATAAARAYRSLTANMEAPIRQRLYQSLYSAMRRVGERPYTKLFSGPFTSTEHWLLIQRKA
jgi:hypothetical protein